jgi:murein L,D-transpeptidase YcbB/YkuD
MTEEQLKSDAGVDRLAVLELVFSDALLELEHDYYKGRLEAKVGDPEWYVKDGKTDVLSQAIAAVEQAGTPNRLVRELMLETEAYSKLKDALIRYRTIDATGGWHAITGWPAKHKRPKVRPGERDDFRVPMLRKRLAMTGDYVPPTEQTPRPASSVMGPPMEGGAGFLDPALARALENFQIRHGLEADGVLGGETLAELNVPASKRVQQIEANLERLRWLPRPLGTRYILVNITDYSLYAFEKDQLKLSMKVVVGQEARRTPSFSAPLRKMVLNPNWFVPHKIASHDLLKIFQKDPEALVHKGFRVFRKRKTGMELVDPLKVPWQELTEDHFPYDIIQAPGPFNSLGEIKFLPPNPFAIYLHGTPKKDLFRKRVRTFSSGCIRVEQPIDLAEYVMKGDSEWDRDALMREVLKGTNRSVKLPKKIPLYLLYFTSWVDNQGQVNFRRDIYGRDAALDASLQWTAARVKWEQHRLDQKGKDLLEPRPGERRSDPNLIQ